MVKKRPLRLEPYGVGDERLLRFLPSGHPLYECPIDLSQEPSSSGPSEELRQAAEAFCVCMDYIHRLKAKLSSSSSAKPQPQTPIRCASYILPASETGSGAPAVADEAAEERKGLIEQDEWRLCREDRDLACRELTSLTSVGDLLCATLSNTQNVHLPPQAIHFLQLADCKAERSPSKQLSDAAAAISSKQRTLLSLLHTIRLQKHDLLHSHCGASSQHHFLSIVRQLLPHWRLNKRRYLAVDFADNTYPYVCEVLVEYFNVPSLCWAKPDEAPPVTSSWLSQKELPVYRSQVARLSLRTEGQRNQVRLTFDGPAAALIERDWHLSVRIYTVPHTHANLPPTPPYPPSTIPPDITAAEAQDVHMCLRRAQWCLIDRALYATICNEAELYDWPVTLSHSGASATFLSVDEECIQFLVQNLPRTSVTDFCVAVRYGPSLQTTTTSEPSRLCCELATAKLRELFLETWRAEVYDVAAAGLDKFRSLKAQERLLSPFFDWMTARLSYDFSTNCSTTSETA